MYVKSFSLSYYGGGLKMRKRYAFILLFLFVGCASVNRRERIPPGINCVIRSHKDSYKVGEPVLITWTLFNGTDARIYALNWRTPFDTIDGRTTGEAWIVERDREEVTYLGMLVSRDAPTEKEYIKMEPWSYVSKEIDLSKSYDMSVPGEYKIYYCGGSLWGLYDIFWEGESPWGKRGRSSRHITLTSNEITVRITKQ